MIEQVKNEIEMLQSEIAEATGDWNLFPEVECLP